MTKPIAILYGTETGNSEDCADELAKDIRKLGLKAVVHDMDDYDHDDLPSEHLLLIVTSTFGNGDPPANAEALMQHLEEERPSLPGLRFAVCALGDTSYPKFAQCGKDFDRLLGELGGDRVMDRVDCDEDFEVPWSRYKKGVVGYLKANPELFPAAAGAAAPASDSAAPASGGGGGFFGKIKSWFGGGSKPAPAAPAPTPTPAAKPAPAAAPKAFSRENPFASKVLSTQLLSGEGSNKETRHYVLDLSGSGISYEAGDCFGVHPRNDTAEVDAIVAALGLDGEAQVTYGGKARALRSVLVKDACLQRISMDLFEAFAGVDGPAKVAQASGDDAVKAFMADHHIVDAAKRCPGLQISAQDFVDALRGLQPRLYSIASSPTQHPNEVHFTIETTRYQWNDRDVKGVASTWLADRVGSDAVPVYLHANPQFRLPAADVPILMIGPGTGIAPFRAFLQERKATGAKGKNWLVFGHQQQSCDFLYGDELKSFEADGTLTTLTCAWSRDTDQKVYVQHKLAENADAVWQWLQDGAVIYVCGDAEFMAPDVHAALAKIAADHGEADGEAFLAKLEQDGRYQRDVY